MLTRLAIDQFVSRTSARRCNGAQGRAKIAGMLILLFLSRDECILDTRKHHGAFLWWSASCAFLKKPCGLSLTQVSSISEQCFPNSMPLKPERHEHNRQRANIWMLGLHPNAWAQAVWLHARGAAQKTNEGARWNSYSTLSKDVWTNAGILLEVCLTQRSLRKDKIIYECFVSPCRLFPPYFQVPPLANPPWQYHSTMIGVWENDI